MRGTLGTSTVGICSRGKVALNFAQAVSMEEQVQLASPPQDSSGVGDLGVSSTEHLLKTSQEEKTPRGSRVSPKQLGRVLQGQGSSSRLPSLTLEGQEQT